MGLSLDQQVATEEEFGRDGRWSELIERLLNDAEGTPDEAERFALLRWAARVFEVRLQDVESAAAVLALVPEPEPGATAVALEQLPEDPASSMVTPPPRVVPPGSFPSLAQATGPSLAEEAGPRSLDDLVAARRWREAVEHLCSCAQSADGADRSAYLFAAAKIHEHELSDQEGAAALLIRALDESPASTRYIEALFKLRARSKQWTAAERDLIRIIARTETRPGSEAMRAALWRKLGDLYRLALHDPSQAAEAYHRALGLDPRDERTRRLLLELDPG
jgi:tetratricopeptide (TPR) repeat protein